MVKGHALITATNISKAYGKQQILNNINFSLNAGSSAVILGRNGVGKSTFLSILAGYLKPGGGTVISYDKIGFVPQNDNLFETLTVKDNLAFWSAASGGTNKTNNLLELFNIANYENKKVIHLSGGMKKSLAICCALIHQPNILIMDEPFTGLDIFYKQELILSLNKLLNMGKGIIYTSHNTDEIKALNSHIYLLKDGELTQNDTNVFSYHPS